MSNSIEGTSAALSSALTANTQRSYEIKNQEGTSGVRSVTTAGSDTLQLTGDAMKLQEAGESVANKEPSFDVRKVEALRKEIAEGRYQVDADQIASRLMAQDAALGQA